MTIADYMDKHPLWTLVYLLILANASFVTVAVKNHFKNDGKP